MRVAITGGTGFLGRNLIAEFAKRSFLDGFSLHLVMLGRSRHGVPLRERVRAHLLDDALAYLGARPDARKYLEDLASRIQFIEFDAGTGVPSDGLRRRPKIADSEFAILLASAV